MWISDLKREILAVLRTAQSAGEYLDQYMIAASTGQAAFRVRAELQDLRRDKLVRGTLRRDRHVWELTARGERIAWGADQLEMR